MAEKGIRVELPPTVLLTSCRVNFITALILISHNFGFFFSSQRVSSCLIACLIMLAAREKPTAGSASHAAHPCWYSLDCSMR